MGGPRRRKRCRAPKFWQGDLPRPPPSSATARSVAGSGLVVPAGQPVQVRADPAKRFANSPARPGQTPGSAVHDNYRPEPHHQRQDHDDHPDPAALVLNRKRACASRSLTASSNCSHFRRDSASGRWRLRGAAPPAESQTGATLSMPPSARPGAAAPSLHLPCLPVWWRRRAVWSSVLIAISIWLERISAGV